ncbi:MAG: retroviral-like aspartic protease family protein [Candidatus Bathyarchaeia archaeon]
MGYVKVRGVLANPSKHELKVEVEFIADTGAIYSVIPQSIAEKLKLKVMDKRKFKIASGDIVEYPVSEAYVTVEGRGPRRWWPWAWRRRRYFWA